jgi:type I restriction enzyme S subunit
MSDELPKGWAEVELRECVDVLDNQRVPVNSSERAKRQGDVPYYGATGQVGWIDEALFDEELLLIGEDGAPFFDKSKPIAYVIKGKSWVNNHAHVIRAKSGISSNQYLKWFLDCFDFNEYVNGTTRLKLTQGAMNRIPVRLAPLAEQRRIVAKLEKLLGQVDACQQRLEKLPTLLKRFRQSVLTAACSGRLTADWREENPSDIASQNITDLSSPLMDGDLPEIPESWRFTNIIPLLSTSRPGMKTGPFGMMLKKQEHTQSGIPVLGIENIGFMEFRPGSKIHITPQKADELADYAVLPGDVLISRSGTVGEVCVVPAGMRLVLLPEIMLPILFCFIVNGSPFVLSQIAELCKGSTREFLNQAILKALVLPLPPVAEQQEIVRRVEGLFALADQLELRLAQARGQVDKLTPSLLARAFAGQLVPQDPTDEPAEKLLEQIRTSSSRKQTSEKAHGN